MDSTGSPFVSYYDRTAGDLKIAHRQAGQWVIDLVDSVGDVGIDTSLAMDAAGVPHISYYDATLGDLKYATRLNGQWIVTTVDASGNVGLHSSLALDLTGQPRISYTSAAGDSLKYAVWADGESTALRSGPSWSTVELKSGWQVAAHTSLTLDEQGQPRISFYDPGWRSLRLAWGESFGAYLPLVPHAH